MPEFQMNGKDAPEFQALDDFTQGYIEAAFFTQSGEEDDGGTIGDKGFQDLAPETLQSMIEDCAQFQFTHRPALTALRLLSEEPDSEIERRAGADFWFTRNGHGCGFWDGDWPEPYATELAEDCGFPLWLSRGEFVPRR